MKFMDYTTADRVRQVLDYDPETGLFTWKVRKGRIRAGSLAGSLRHGRHVIKIDDNQYQASRLAYLWMKGEWPPCVVDHRDMDKRNNSWSNLRLATHSQNQCNIRARSDNAVGLKGVTHKGRTFQARISVDGKLRHIGTLGQAEDAHSAYVAAAKRHFGEFARSA